MLSCLIVRGLVDQIPEIPGSIPPRRILDFHLVLREGLLIGVLGKKEQQRPCWFPGVVHGYSVLPSKRSEFGIAPYCIASRTLSTYDGRQTYVVLALSSHIPEVTDA